MTDTKKKYFVFFFIFFISLVVNSIPPLMLTFQQKFSISVGESSLINLFTTLGSMTANISIGVLISRIGIKKGLILTNIVALSGTFLIAVSPNYPLLILSMLIFGAGTGGNFASLTTLFGSLDKKSQNFGLFHAFFGLGGIIAPLIVNMVFYLKINYQFLYGIYTIAFLILILYVKFSEIVENKKFISGALHFDKEFMLSPLIYLSLLSFLLYAGSEVGSINWSGNMLHSVIGISAEVSGMVLSTFWILFTIARVITNSINNKIGEINTILFFSVFQLINIVMLPLTKNYVFFALMGLSMGPIFPSIQKYMNGKIPEEKRSLYNGFTYFCGNTGSMIISTAMGIVGSYSLIVTYMIPFFTFLTIIYAIIKLSKYSYKG